MTILNSNRNHGYITYVSISLAKEVVRQNLFFSVLLTIIFFHNIRSNVPPDIAVKKIETAIAAAHFITQY